MARSAALIVIAAVTGVVLYWQTDVIHRGGPIMIVIVMCSIFSLAFVFERLWFFFQLHLGTDIERFFQQLREAIHARKWEKAQALCQAWKGPVSRVIVAGLAVKSGTPQEIVEAMEDAAHAELPELERHLRSLSTLAQVSTLLGLLGTVTGLVKAFQVIQTNAVGGNPVSPGDLAGGVWEALLTTVAGLVVAIPTILAHNYFAGRVGDVQFYLEKASAMVSGWRRSSDQ